jgi:myo-inositol-1-phosphate synthase
MPKNTSSAGGDPKRAVDEYYSEIFYGGHSANIFNECEDSLLVTPLNLEPTFLAEFLTRVKYKVGPLPPRLCAGDAPR